MVKLSILFLSIFLSIFISADELPKLIKQVSKEVNRAGTIDLKDGCSNCQKPISTTATIYSELNKKTIELSIVTKEEADLLVTEFLNMKDIPFDYALDGCFARAHKIAILLEQKKIITGKAFIMGRLFANTKYGPANWRYHVAPILYVRENDQIIPYIIDPSLSDKAMKFEDWKNLITGVSHLKNPKLAASKSVQYFTNRFIYDPTSVQLDLVEFQPGDISDMENALVKYQEIKQQLDKKKGVI